MTKIILITSVTVVITNRYMFMEGPMLKDFYGEVYVRKEKLLPQSGIRSAVIMIWGGWENAGLHFDARS